MLPFISSDLKYLSLREDMKATLNIQMTRGILCQLACQVGPHNATRILQSPWHSL